jgi:hypothetical protein
MRCGPSSQTSTIARERGGSTFMPKLRMVRLVHSSALYLSFVFLDVVIVSTIKTLYTFHKRIILETHDLESTFVRFVRENRPTLSINFTSLLSGLIQMPF